MKKSMKKTMVPIVLIVAVLIAGGILAGKTLLKKEVNVSWYNDEETEFIIETADQLYELAEIAEYRNLSGKTFKLGADIVVNEGNASEWIEKGPSRRWYPIKKFAGTFDGQGHTISGLYGNVYDKSMGLFINTKPSAVIKNFKLVNTYFKAIGSPGTASIAGGTKNSGKFEKIYTDAIIDCDGLYTAGIVSFVTGGDTTISECWFDGSIMRYYYNHTGGGIVSQVNAAKLNVEHCLNSGTIVNDEVQTYARVGGICGVVGSSGMLNVIDCLNVGEIESKSSKQVGSIVGFIGTSSTANFKTVFATTESYSATVGGNGDRANGGVIQFYEDDILGYDAYYWTNLDFANYWTVKEDNTPELQCFAEKIVSTEGTKKIHDTNWYTGTDSEYTLTTKEQLYGLAYLSASEQFKGITVKLGADIVINEGDAKDWSKEAPENPWIPIMSWDGIFDGQGHTISGVYLNGGGTMGLFNTTKKDSVVKNVRLTNSYYKNNSTSNAYTGGIAGTAGGEFNTIYSDVIIESTGIGAGGIVGHLGSGTPKIINCWFEGQIHMKDAGNSAGGILGYATVGGRIEHCLNSGKLSAERKDNYTRVGGICGVVGSSSLLTVTDCLNTGHINSNKWQAGSIIGFIGSKSSATLDTVCTTVEGYDVAIGGGADRCSGMAIQYYEEDLLGAGGYKWTNLDYTNYWAIVKNRTPILKSFATSTLSTKGLQRKFDISWYSKDKKSFTIKDAQDLYGVSILAGAGESFEKQSIKLGADIVVNAGDASAWASNPPSDTWIPIANFCGTFDGQGHTISGLYKNDGTNIGLFATTKDKATIKNLCVENSYFVNKQTTGNVYIGGIVGQGGGNFDTVYSDVIIETTGIGVGGIIGHVNIQKTKFKNCWFAGELSLIGEEANSAGGMAGIVQKDTTVESCLNSGELKAERTTGYTRTAGFIGVISQADVKITDSLNVGTINAINRQAGSFIGFIGATATATFGNDVYASEESCSSVVGGKTGKVNGSVIQISVAKIKGEKAKTNASRLSFNSNWMTLSKRTPILKSFASKAPTIVTKGMTPDTSWYNKTDKEFTLTTAAQLYGVEELSYDTDFAGVTIKLGNNITINTGTASTWSESAPKYVWYPIQNFAGTFDGQGYEISGLYHVEGKNVGLFNETTASSVVKNLRLANSYFANTTAMDAVHIGSVAGQGGGTFDTIYSDIIIVTTGQGVGGIIGNNNIAETKINNCWFNGKISLEGENAYSGGGMVGIVASNVTLTNCLNSAPISAERKNAYNRIGGMVGVANGKTVVAMEDCLSVGKITRGVKEEVISKQVGSIIGYVPPNATLSADGVYATAESYEIAIGSGKVDGTIVVAEYEKFVAKNAFATASGLNYENVWAAVEGKAPILRSFLGNETVVEEEKYDTGWYTTEEAGATFTITTESQLFGLAELSKEYDFAGQIIYLAEDIPVSDEKVWTPIGSEVPFAGTFTGEYPKDSGNVHTISGLFVDSGVNIGLFAQTTKDSVISNIKLLDSRFENLTATGEVNIGSIVGKGGGTLDTIYSEVIIITTGQGAGGIIGKVNVAGTTMNNCWFNGQLSLKGENAYSGGGMVGIVAKGVAFTNCLNSAPISAERQNAYNRLGGMVGVANGSTVVSMEDCLNVGKITRGVLETVISKQVGSIIGYIPGTATVSANGVYATTESYEIAIGSGTVAGEITTEAKAKFIGAEAYKTADKLDYDTYWSAIVGETPVLQSFKGDKVVAEKPSEPQPPAGPIEITAYEENKTATEFVIKNVEQLYKFAELSASYDFAGQTIYLANDIVVNKLSQGQTAEDWATSAPSKTWTPIGTSNYPFKGTFDGNGYTISGLYVKGTLNNFGLFGRMNGGTIQNLRLTDTYFEINRSSSQNPGNVYGGSVLGSGNGTIQNVYSNAIVKSYKGNGLGGFVGAARKFDTAKDLIIENCWFDGKLTITDGGTRGGGFIGLTDVANLPKSVSISNCLNSGTITQTGNYASYNYDRIGGICGYLTGAIDVTITDCLNVGNIVADTAQYGAIIGRIDSTTKVVLNDVYAMTGSCAAYCGSNANTSITITDNFVAEADLKGDSAKTNASGLDFTDTWVAREGNTPILKYFYWYSPEKTVLIIRTADELYEFAALSAKTDFAGKTIYLGADIKVNTLAQGQTAEDWATSAPSKTWTPIGTSNYPFKGTFDGNGYTISGLYVKGTLNNFGLFGRMNGGTIQNLRLTDTYFEINRSSSQNPGNVYGGSVLGSGNGTIQNVYSNAIVKSYKGNGLGGFVGAARKFDTAKDLIIENCWFDGKLTITDGGTRGGGFIGLTDVANLPKSVSISNCLNSGTITQTGNYASYNYDRIGGICGYLTGAIDVTITDCLNVGNIVADTAQYGAIIGRIDSTTKVVLNDVYAMTGSCAAYCGSNANTSITITDNFVAEADLKGDSAKTNASGLDFTDTWVAREGNTPILKTFSDVVLTRTTAVMSLLSRAVAAVANLF